MRIKFRILLILVCNLFINCDKIEPNGFVGEEIFLIAKNPDNIKSLKYKWALSEKPENSILKIKHMKTTEDLSTIKFIPDQEGHYNLKVSVLWYGEVISTQLFPLEIGKKKESVKTEKKKLTTSPKTSWTESVNAWLEDSEKLSNKVPTVSVIADTIAKTDQFNPPKNIGYYTIQVASKKDKKSAELFMKKMQLKGFNSYIQDYNKQKTNELWYRVRVGFFSTKDSAMVSAKTIRDTMSIETWIDYVRETKE